MNNDKKKKNFWIKFWKILKPYHKKLAWLLFSSIIVVIAQLTGPYILKIFVDKITDFNIVDLNFLLLLVLLYFCSEYFVSFLSYKKNNYIFSLYFAIEAYLHTEAQKKLLYLSLSYHEKENTGNKIIKISNGIQKILDLIGNLSWEVAPTIVQIITTVTVFFVLDWRFAVSLLFFIPLFLVLTYIANKKLYPDRKKRYERYERAAGEVTQSIVNINTVKSFVQERRETKKYKSLRDTIKNIGSHEWITLMKHWLFRDIIVDLGRSTILLIAIYLLYKENVSIGGVVFVLTLSERVYHSMYRLSRFYDRVEEGAIAVERLTNLLSQESDIVNFKNALKPKNIKGQVEFSGVTFAYDNSSENALNNINLRISLGAVTALVGPSGGGKTTIARMIYRHYDPQKGKVLLDGRSLKDYDLYYFRKYIAIVPQEVEIFSDTVKNNIAYAYPEASDEEIIAASKIANAHEFIEKLSQKYDTEVGERGIKLSGGQRQRVGIARAILANPKILIFDEATSNLDSQSEKLIQDAMDKISKGRTMIIIAHRLSTIKKADKIVVLENGSIVEQGNHIELAQKKGGLYSKLLNLQKLGDVA